MLADDARLDDLLAERKAMFDRSYTQMSRRRARCCHTGDGFARVR